MSKETGGPAFPTIGTDIDGMTLRDYFAAKAMQGIQSRVNWDMVAVARLAYEQADEMLKAREQDD